MGERKVLNKYYPPDFDPSKIPRRRMPKDRQYTVRLMAPFNMRCVPCGEYIYKGKKFNAKKETVLGETYLGLAIFRFYIRCTRCATAITFKTDPKNTDYVCETGATRNFENWREVDDSEDAAAKQEEFEEQNPMAALEERTKESKREMDILDALEEIKDSNARKFNIDIDEVLKAKEDAKRELLQKRQQRLDAADDAEVRAAFGIDEDEGSNVRLIRRLESSDEDDGQGGEGEAEQQTEGGRRHRPLKRAKRELRVGGMVIRSKGPSSDQKRGAANPAQTPSEAKTQTGSAGSLPSAAGTGDCDGDASSDGGGGGLVGDYGSTDSDE